MHQGIINSITIFLFASLQGFYACERNHAPEISGVTCSPESRSAGTTFTLKVTASDPDGDTLSYLWSADGGIFLDSINTEQTRWKSPVDGNGKIFSLTITVSDGEEETGYDYAITLTEPVFGDIAGFVYYAKCKVPVPEAFVTLDGQSGISDTAGYYEIENVPVGNYELIATKKDFGPVKQPVSITKYQVARVNLSMTSVVFSSKVYGIVKDQDSLPLAGAKVTMMNPDASDSEITAVSKSDGSYLLWYVPVGYRTIIARKERNNEFGFDDNVLTANITGPEFPLDFELTRYNLTGRFTDPRDGHVYGYRIIGTQTWMTENLRYMQSVNPSTDGSTTGKQYYVYGYEGRSIAEAMNEPNYSTYGVLYNWPSAKSDCPVGWHLPSETEWKNLLTYLGADAGHKLKSTSLWENHGNGSNESGMKVLPAGQRSDQFGFVGLGRTANFWTSTQINISKARFFWLSYDSKDARRSEDLTRRGFSVRCVRD